MSDNTSTQFSDGMQRLHNLLYTAQTSTGAKQSAAVNEARIVLYRLRDGAPVRRVIASGEPSESAGMPLPEVVHYPPPQTEWLFPKGTL